MTTPAQLAVWAERILEGLEDTTSSQDVLVTWLQYNLPKLNLSIGTDFYLSSGNIMPDMSFNESGIYEEIYYCDRFRKKASALLGGTSFQDVVEFRGQEQGSVRFASFSERAKAYQSLAKDCQAGLTNLINWYGEISGVYAMQILYNLRDDPAGYGLKEYCPPGSYFRDYNTVWTNTTPY